MLARLGGGGQIGAKAAGSEDLPACRTRQLLSEAHSKLRRAV